MKALLFFAVVIFSVTWINKKLKKEEQPMSTQTQQATANKTNTEHVTHNTIHDVFIANTHLIGDKLLGLLTHIIGEEDEHGLHSIIFTENYPRTVSNDPVVSRFYADARSIVVNLQCHLEMAKARMKQPTSRVQFWHYCWMQLIKTLYHEIRHAEKYLDADDIYSVDKGDKWEEDAEEYAHDMLVELAKTVDIEPPSPADFPFFSKQVIDLYQSIVDAEKPEPWEEIQGYAIVSELCYFDPGMDGKTKPVEIPTLREYIKRLADDDDVRWGKPVGSMADIAAAVKAETKPEPEPKPVQQEMFTVTTEEGGTLTTDDVSKVINAAGMHQALTGEKVNITKTPVEDEVAEVIFNAEAKVVNQPAAPVAEEPTPYVPDEGCPFDPFDGVIDEMELDGMIDHAMTEGRMELNIPETKVELPKPVAPTPTMAGGNVSIDLGLNPGDGKQVEMPKPAMKQLEPTGLSADEQMAVLQQVLFRLYAHIFQKCGWNYAGGFTNLNGIHEPVYIGDIPGANKLFHSYEVVENKSSVEKRVEDHIVGHIMPKAGIPGYHLYLNVNGMKGKRAFLPQNPNKTKANSQELTAWAKRARAGEMIGMLSQEGKGVRVSIITPVGGNTTYENDPFKK